MGDDPSRRSDTEVPCLKLLEVIKIYLSQCFEVLQVFVVVALFECCRYSVVAQ